MLIQGFNDQRSLLSILEEITRKKRTWDSNLNSFAGIALLVLNRLPTDIISSFNNNTFQEILQNCILPYRIDNTFATSFFIDEVCFIYFCYFFFLKKRTVEKLKHLEDNMIHLVKVIKKAKEYKYYLSDWKNNIARAWNKKKNELIIFS